MLINKDIVVPDMGDFKDVTVIEVLVSKGSEVCLEQTLLTLESDKATMELPSSDAGVITEVLVTVGDKVSLGDIIFRMDINNSSQLQIPSQNSNEATRQPQSVSSSPTTSPVSSNEAIPLCIPDMGDFKDVAVIEVLISEGSEVCLEQTLLTLESDKATMEVPSSSAGTITDVLVAVGDRVSSGDRIALIFAHDNHRPPLTVEKSTSKQKNEVLPSEGCIVVSSTLSEDKDSSKDSSPNIYAGPAVRRLARQLGVDLSLVRGSGRYSRIVKEDVEAYVKSTLLSSPSADSSTTLGTSLPPMPVIDFSQFGDITRRPLSRIEKKSGQNLHRNWLGAPQVTQFGIADITDMQAFRQSLKSEIADKGYKITPLTFLIKAAAITLRQFTTFNASLDSDGKNLIVKKYYHIGVATDTRYGLVVPVIRDVDTKNLFEIASELSRITDQAKEGKLKPGQMQGGCFTLSSLGGLGGSYFTPIVNLPEVAILGISKAQTAPHWDGEKFVPRLQLPLSLSYDHRIIDGADAARFMAYYTKLLGDIRRFIL